MTARLPTEEEAREWLDRAGPGGEPWDRIAAEDPVAACVHRMLLDRRVARTRATPSEALAEREVSQHAARARGFVYFARAVGGGPIKIGHSRWPAQRAAALEYRGGRVELLATFDGGELRERELHRLFARHRLPATASDGGTEWFAPAPEILDFVRRPFRLLDPIPEPQ